MDDLLIEKIGSDLITGGVSLGALIVVFRIVYKAMTDERARLGAERDRMKIIERAYEEKLAAQAAQYAAELAAQAAMYKAQLDMQSQLHESDRQNWRTEIEYFQSQIVDLRKQVADLQEQINH
jgi:chromosome segregation ATPase